MKIKLKGEPQFTMTVEGDIEDGPLLPEDRAFLGHRLQMRHFKATLVEHGGGWALEDFTASAIAVDENREPVQDPRLSIMVFQLAFEGGFPDWAERMAETTLSPLGQPLRVLPMEFEVSE